MKPQNPFTAQKLHLITIRLIILSPLHLCNFQVFAESWFCLMIVLDYPCIGAISNYCWCYNSIELALQIQSYIRFRLMTCCPCCSGRRCRQRATTETSWALGEALEKLDPPWRSSGRRRAGSRWEGNNVGYNWSLSSGVGVLSNNIWSHLFLSSWCWSKSTFGWQLHWKLKTLGYAEGNGGWEE